MVEIRRASRRRARLLRFASGRRTSRRLPQRAETELGCVGAQARRVAGALTALVAIGVVVGCFGSPAGVECRQHAACSNAHPCAECVHVPGCGALHLAPAEACRESCPLALECSFSAECPARVRCAGLVPGRSAALADGAKERSSRDGGSLSASSPAPAAKP